MDRLRTERKRQTGLKLEHLERRDLFCFDSPVEPLQTNGEVSIDQSPALAEISEPHHDFAYGTLKFGVTLSKSSEASSRVAYGGARASLEFTEFRMDMSSGREGSSGEATARRAVHPAWCELWVSGAFPLLMQAQIQNHVSEGTYQFYAPAAAGEEMVRTWSIAFDNGRINRIELVSDSDPTTPDYVELELVMDQWDFIAMCHNAAGTVETEIVALQLDIAPPRGVIIAAPN